jgi:hypothetical protein
LGVAKTAFLSAPDFLRAAPDNYARAVCLDPPYSTSPNSVRGRDDGADAVVDFMFRALLAYTPSDTPKGGA